MIFHLFSTRPLRASKPPKHISAAEISVGQVVEQQAQACKRNKEGASQKARKHKKMDTPKVPILGDVFPRQ